MKSIKGQRKKKYPITSTVCHYVMAQKGHSARAMARLFSIHHSTWQGYLAGMHEPNVSMRKKIVALMKVESFDELVRLSLRYYRRTV